MPLNSKGEEERGEIKSPSNCLKKRGGYRRNIRKGAKKKKLIPEGEKRQRCFLKKEKRFG